MFKVHEPQVPEIKVVKVRLISCHCAETINQVGNTAVRNKWRYSQRQVHQTWRACDRDCRHIPTDSQTDKQINQCQPNTALQTGVVGVPRKQKFRNQKKNAYKKFFKTYECKFTNVNSDFFYWLKIFVESYELIINSMHKNMFSPVLSSRGDGRDGVMVIFYSN